MAGQRRDRQASLRAQHVSRSGKDAFPVRFALANDGFGVGQEQVVVRGWAAVEVELTVNDGP